VGLAIAINISVGAPGQIAGVWIYKADQAERGYPTGHWTNAGLLFFVAVGCVGLRIYYGLLNRRIMKGNRTDESVKRLYRYWTDIFMLILKIDVSNSVSSPILMLLLFLFDASENNIVYFVSQSVRRPLDNPAIEVKSLCW
jgi:hypothetical protein